MNLFKRFTKSLFHSKPSPQEAALDPLIERVVDNFNPEIRRIRGYKQKLKAPVESAKESIARLAKRIPGPLDVTDPSTFEDLIIKPFFINYKSFKKAIRKDQDLNDYLNQNPPEIFYVLFTMNCSVKTAFSAELKGEIIVRDIAVKMVNASDFKFRVPADTMDETLKKFNSGALEILAHHALERILEQQKRNAELEKMQDNLMAKIDFFEFEKQRMIVRPENSEAAQICKEAQAMLKQIDKELDTHHLTLDYYMEQLCDVLSHPGQHFSDKVISLKLDRMSNLIEDPDNDESNPIHLLEAGFPPVQNRSAMFLKCSRDVILANA